MIQPVSRPALTRRACVVATGLASGTLLAACGAQRESGAGGAAPVLRSGVILQVMNWSTGDAGRVQQDVINQFTAQHPGIKVEFGPVASGQYWDKLAGQLAAGSPPDVGWMNAQNFGKFVTSAPLLDLGPHPKRDKVDLKDFWPASVELYSYKGSPWALTSQYDSRGFFVNKALFDKAGVPYPPVDYKDTSWTWDKFLDVAKRLSRAGEGTWPVSIPTGYIHTTPWVWSGGGDLLNKDKTEVVMTSAATVDAFQILADLMHKHQVSPTPAEQSAQQGSLAMFQAGKLAMLQVHSANIGDGRKAAGFDWDAAALPRGKAGPAMQASGPAWIIPEPSRNREEAWALTKVLTSPDAQKQLAAGGAALVGRKSVAEAVYRDMPPPPKNAHVFVDGMAYLKADPFTSNWSDVETAMNEELAPLWRGDRPARETMAAIKARVDPLLKAAK